MAIHLAQISFYPVDALHAGAKALAQVLKCTDGPFMDLLHRCFAWDPEQRITPEQVGDDPLVGVKGLGSGNCPIESWWVGVSPQSR